MLSADSCRVSQVALRCVDGSAWTVDCSSRARHADWQITNAIGPRSWNWKDRIAPALNFISWQNATCWVKHQNSPVSSGFPWPNWGRAEVKNHPCGHPPPAPLPRPPADATGSPGRQRELARVNMSPADDLNQVCVSLLSTRRPNKNQTFSPRGRRVVGRQWGCCQNRLLWSICIDASDSLFCPSIIPPVTEQHGRLWQQWR